MRLALALSFLSFAAFAGPVGLGVGQTKHVKVSQRVAHVEVSNPSRIEISHHGQSIKLTGKEQGRTTINVTTVDGAEVSLDVHVISPGGSVFTVESKGNVAPVKKEKKPATVASAKADSALPANAQAQDVP